MNRYSVNKLIAGVARFMSTALTPLLMPTYGIFLILWVSVLCLLPYGSRVAVLLVCMGITCIVPLTFLSVLRHFSLIKDLHVNVREQRLFPYQGLSAFDMLWLLCLSIIVAGLLGSSRLILKRHDIWQVLVGAMVGFLCVSLTMRLLG